MAPSEAWWQLVKEKEEKKVKGDLMEKKSASLGHGVHGKENEEKESCKNAEAMVLMTELRAQQWSEADGNSLEEKEKEKNLITKE